MDKSGAIEAYPDNKAPPTLSKTKSSNGWWKLGGEDVSYVSVNAGYEESETPSLEHNSSDEALVKNKNNVFDAPEASEIYKPIAGFEGSHRFDPSATWTQAEEKELVRRVCTIDHIHQWF